MVWWTSSVEVKSFTRYSLWKELILTCTILYIRAFYYVMYITTQFHFISLRKILWLLNRYSMPRTVWTTKNISKWTSNVQLLCSNASAYSIIYSWWTSNPKMSIWVHTRAKIHSFSKCQNSDHFWGCEKKHTSNSTRLQWDLLIMVKRCFLSKTNSFWKIC